MFPPDAHLPRTDVHQHLWPPALVDVLARRSALPFARAEGRRWLLHVAAEPAVEIPVEDGTERAARLAADGVELALLSLSTALRAETLDPWDAQPLLDAWHGAARALPKTLGAWGSLNLREAEPVHVDALLDEGFVGLCLPASALRTPARVERLGPLLERLERRRARLFVHPGPAPAPSDRSGGPWWPAVAEYPASLHLAWCAWLRAGTANHPRLRVVFAALAGLAPLHAERATARGAPVAAPPAVFYDTSSYGPRAIAAMRRAVGVEQLVHGSDLPVLDGVRPPADEALLQTNPARLLA